MGSPARALRTTLQQEKTSMSINLSTLGPHTPFTRLAARYNISETNPITKLQQADGYIITTDFIDRSSR